MKEGLRGMRRNEWGGVEGETQRVKARKKGRGG